MPHPLRTHPRLTAAALIGIAVGLVAPADTLVTKVLIGWNAGVWTYLVLMFWLATRARAPDVKRIAEKVAADDNITLVKGNGPAPGYHHGPDNVRTAVYFEDPDGLVVEVYSTEIEMIETNRRLLLDRL